LFSPRWIGNKKSGIITIGDDRALFVFVNRSFGTVDLNHEEKFFSRCRLPFGRKYAKAEERTLHAPYKIERFNLLYINAHLKATLTGCFLAQRKKCLKVLRFMRIRNFNKNAVSRRLESLSAEK
jgi:hypothetical protein